MTLLYIPPCRMMPTSPSSGPKRSLSLRSLMNSIAAGRRFSIFSLSWAKEAGGRTMRFTSRTGCSSACARVNCGRRLLFATNCPWTWQARIRTSSMTGVLDASDSSKPSSTALTMDSRLGRGSSSHICDFMAKAWLRSCGIDEPSPKSSPRMTSAPPLTPLEARLVSASEATFVPAVDFQVTAPRSG